MGMVNLKLDLPPDEEVRSQQTLKLRPQCSETDETLEKRVVSGTVTVEYHWTPMNTVADGAIRPAPIALPTTNDDGGPWKGKRQEENPPDPITGRLKVTVVCADQLINLSYHRSTKSLSNPFAMVFLYPNSPKYGEALCPQAWRTACVLNTLSPRWEAGHTWPFAWLPSSLESPRTVAFRESVTIGDGAAPRIHPEPNASDSDSTYQGMGRELSNADTFRELKRFGEDVCHLRDQVRSVSDRILHKIEARKPVLEPFVPP
jgi:hypothetical protein